MSQMRFELDSVVKVETPQETYVGVLKSMDSQEIWLECFLHDRAHGFGNILIQRHYQAIVVTQVVGCIGRDQYLSRELLWINPHLRDQRIPLAVVNAMGDPHELAKIVQLSHARCDLHENDCPWKVTFIPALLRAVERIQDVDVLRELANKQLVKEVAEAVTKRLAQQPRALGAPYRST